MGFPPPGWNGGFSCAIAWRYGPPQSCGFSSYCKIKSTPNLFFQRGFDTDHQLIAAIGVDVQVRIVSIVAVVDERTPRGGQATSRAQGEPVTVVFARDLEGAAVEKIGIVVAADAIFGARVGLPAAAVAQSDGREQRMPRRRGAEEVGPLLEIPAIVELELIADAHEGGRRREARVSRKALLPSVEILEPAAAFDVPELIAPAQIVAGTQTAARLHIDHRGLLEAAAADVDHVEVAAGAGL